VRRAARNQASTRLKRKSKAVELNVDEVTDGVAGLAARGDVGTAGLLDGDGDCDVAVSNKFMNGNGAADFKEGTYGWECSSS
jgi:hypothetical protein